MKKKVVLIGHCGPDSSYLRMAVSSAGKEIQVTAADDASTLSRVLADGVHLALVNRELPWGFEHTEGIEVMRRLKDRHPQLRWMLVSNYPDAQQAAQQAGALPGFGKREIGTPRVKQVLSDALK